MARWKKRKGIVVAPSHGGKFPKDSESRLEKLLVSFNTEPKQVSMLAMFDEWSTGQDIWYTFNELGTDWIPNNYTLMGYCDNEFLPNGFVRQHSFLFDGNDSPTKRYRISEDGRHFARRAASFMLNYGIQEKRSVYELIGSAISCGSSHRIKIMRLLRKNVGVQKELADEVNVTKMAVRKQILSLHALGFIAYDLKSNGNIKDIRVTDKGQEFLDSFIEPLSVLCETGRHEAVESAYTKLQDKNILRSYAQQGIKQYRSIATRNYSKTRSMDNLNL